jgi:FMN phosphatase YigB (HAD superfamily)
MFSRALQSLGLSPAEAVMVGDSFENDVLGARAFGLRAVLKLIGREPTPRERSGAGYLIDGLEQIFDLGMLG